MTATPLIGDRVGGRPRPALSPPPRPEPARPEPPRRAAPVIGMPGPARMEASAQPAPQPAAPTLPDRLDGLRRYTRLLVALAVCGAAAALIASRLLDRSTRDAVLSGAPIVLRAPIEGVFVAEAPPALGGVLPGGAVLGEIRNDRVDDNRLAQLRADLAGLDAEIAALGRRLAALGEETSAARAQAEAFRGVRLDQLRARLSEAEATARAARARLAEAERSWRRAEALLQQAAATPAAADLARRNLAVAREEVVSVEERRSALQAEIRAATGGVFGADGATDRSASQQLLDRVRLARAELAAQRGERAERAEALRAQLAAEAARVQALQRAAVEIPREARLTALLVQPGEFVRLGQDIGILADCAQPLVTALVDDAVYRNLAVGDPARFVPAGRGAAAAGRIVHLAAPLEQAAAERSAARPPARVVVRLDTAARPACEVGRMGALSF